MKKMTLPLAVFVGILGCVLAVSANVTTIKMHDQLKQERYYRIQAESQLQNTQRTLNILQKQVAETNQDLGSIREILDKRDTEKGDMKAQLNQLIGEKEALVKQVGELKSQGATPPETQAVP